MYVYVYVYVDGWMDEWIDRQMFQCIICFYTIDVKECRISIHSETARCAVPAINRYVHRSCIPTYGVYISMAMAIPCCPHEFHPKRRQKVGIFIEPYK